MVCHFRRTVNSYVATQLNFLNITAGSSATNGYVVVPERFGQIGYPASRNEERAVKKHSFVPGSENNRYKMKTLKNVNFIHHLYVFCLCFLFKFGAFFSNSLFWKILLIFCLWNSLFCRRGSYDFDVPFWRIGAVVFLSKDGKDAVYERRNGRRGVDFPPDLAFFLYS